MIDINKYTGAVNISADITPTLREKVESVSPETWHEMNIENLWNQRLILNERVILAHRSGHSEVARQVQIGISHIDAYLQMREAEKLEAIKTPPRAGTLR